MSRILSRILSQTQTMTRTTANKMQRTRYRQSIHAVVAALMTVSFVCAAQTAVHTPAHTPAATSATPSNTNPADPTPSAAAPMVQLESTIQGNPEQPKTIYVLPWQESVARIKMNGDDVPPAPQATQPLDRDDFLRFIDAQGVTTTPVPSSDEQTSQTPIQQ